MASAQKGGGGGGVIVTCRRREGATDGAWTKKDAETEKDETKCETGRCAEQGRGGKRIKAKLEELDKGKERRRTAPSASGPLRETLRRRVLSPFQSA